MTDTISEAPVGRLGLDNPPTKAPVSSRFGKHQVVLDGGINLSRASTSRKLTKLAANPVVVGSYHDYKDAQKARKHHAEKNGHSESHYTIRSGSYQINESGEEELILDTTPLIEWTKPVVVGDEQTPPSEDISEEEEIVNEKTITIQPVEDLNDLFEIVHGVEDFREGETIDNVQVENLRELGYTVIEQSIDETQYHVHAEVSPRGVPLTHNHRIPINAKSEAEAKSKARAHAKDRGWKIHNIQKVTLAEDADPEFELVEEFEDQDSGPTKFSEITAPVIDESSNPDTTPPEQLDESWGVKVSHFDEFKRNAQDYADHKTSHGKVEYQHHIAGPFGDKHPAWHQTSAIVDHPKHGRINIGTFNHKHGKNSPHGHGQVLDSYMADDDD
jgi:hypothetical protein